MKVTKEEFDESADFEPEFIIGKEPVDDVIYATGKPMVSFELAAHILNKNKPSEPEEWDGEVLNSKFGRTAAFEKYKMLFKGEHCLVYKSESHYECAGRVDECEFRPIKSEAELEREKEREAGICDMYEAVENEPYTADEMADDDVFDFCRRAYDFGYRKTK